MGETVGPLTSHYKGQFRNVSSRHAGESGSGRKKGIPKWFSKNLDPGSYGTIDTYAVFFRDPNGSQIHSCVLWRDPLESQMHCLLLSRDPLES